MTAYEILSLFIGSNHKTTFQLLCSDTSDISTRRSTLLNETKDFIAREKFKEKREKIAKAEK